MKKKNRRDINKDYEYSSLPTTRKEAFKDVYRHNFKTIFSCGVMLLLFSLPLIAFLIVMNIGRLGMNTDTYSEEVLESVLLVWDLILNGGVIVLLYVFLIGLMGVMRVLKLLVWQEGINFGHDFRVGIKENIKQMTLFYVFGALIYAATYCVYIFLLQFIIGISLILLFTIIFVPIIFWSFYTINVYQTTFFNYLKNGLFFYAHSIGWTLLFVVVVIWPFFLMFIPMNGYLFLIKYPIIILLILFYYPFLLIVGYLYALSKFDKHINQENYPEIYRKGLYDINKK